MNNGTHIDVSLFGNRIMVGKLAKNKLEWKGDPEDITGLAAAAVAKFVINKGEPAIVTENGKPRYKISVEEIEA